MTGDQPLWPRDSEQEDAEAHRARELAKLEAWTAEQKVRPLADALESHGLIRERGETWAGPVILPGWWDEIPEPHDQCMWCQRRGVPSPCGECRAARAADADPAAAWAWWASLTAGARRLHIAATYGTDPWSGRRCTIRVEWTELTTGSQIRTEQLAYRGCAPDGIYWGAVRRG